MINCSKEFESDVLNAILCNAGLQTQNLQRMYELNYSSFATQKYRYSSF